MNNFLSNMLLQKVFYEQDKYFPILYHALHIDKVTFETLYVFKKALGSGNTRSSDFSLGFKYHNPLHILLQILPQLLDLSKVQVISEIL